MSDLNRGLIEKIGSRVEIVEKRLSQLERNNPTINIPALNELRYALVHLLRYLKSENSQSQEVEAENADKHARRAYYDCFEAEALYYFREFGQFEETFKEINILEYISDYIDWGGVFEELRVFMQSFPKDKREQYCEELEIILVRIRPIHSKLKTARIELFKYIEKLNRENKKLEEEKVKAEEALRIAKETIAIREASLNATQKSNKIAIWAVVVAFSTTILMAFLNYLKSS